jgi:predicted kinase
MLKKLYIMIGPAGSGKTTWVRNHAKPGKSAHISRDEIRFSMVGEDEYYFSKEDDVYAEYCKEIHDALHCPWVEEVYADATHLNKKSRERLIKEIYISPEWVEIHAIVIMPTLMTCLAQNAFRSGRERVPETVICKMYNGYQSPYFDDIDYSYIEENGNIIYGEASI